MNLTHLKYALTVAQTHSLNQAALELYVNQSALSRAIKELENDLGTTLFERSAKGMFLTSEGEVFMIYARQILRQVNEVSELFKNSTLSKKRFSISVPRAAYIAEAFANFSLHLSGDDIAEIYYSETNSMQVIKNILQEGYKLGVVRYCERYDNYYKDMIINRNFHSEVIATFKHSILVSKASPLASLKEIHYEDLAKYTLIAHPDTYVPSRTQEEVRNDELSKSTSTSRIFIVERASQLELLEKNKNTYMWVSGVTPYILEHSSLVCRRCIDNHRAYNDVLIYDNNYSLTELDRLFIDYLYKARDNYFENSL